jgi:phosphoglycerate kinase
MLKSIKNVDIENKTVLLRLDLNVPIQDGKIQSDFRIIKSVPTILHLLKNNNSIIILSHQGRPNEGKIMPSLSLKKISQHLSKQLGHEIEFIENWISGIKIEKNRIIRCENVRFQKGERANDKILSKKIASLGDIFVFDASFL